MSDTGLTLEERVRLVELVDRVLDRGVVLGGSVTIGVAGVDLVYLELHLLLSSVESLVRRGGREVLPATGGRESGQGTDASDLLAARDDG